MCGRQVFNQPLELGIIADETLLLERQEEAAPDIRSPGWIVSSAHGSQQDVVAIAQRGRPVTGHMDAVGGAMFTKPAVDFVGLQSAFQPKRRKRKPSKKRKSRVRGLPASARDRD